MGSLLSIGIQAMMANQAAIQAVGQNIANANTAGYSRQSVILTTPNGQFTGGGFFGRGVNVQTVERAHNEFLTSRAVNSKATAHMDSTSMDKMSQLEKVFPPGETGLGAAAGQFLSAMVDVTSRPSDPSARQVVMGRATELASRFASAGQQLGEMQAGVISDMRTNVDVVNQLAQQIAFANREISGAVGTGHMPNDLLDKRDRLISNLSEYVQVSTLTASDGSVGVFIGGGQSLVLGAKAESLSVTPDSYDNKRGALSIGTPGNSRQLDESVLTGGSLTALLRFQNKDLQDARNMLGQMSAAISYRVNSQQKLGLDLSDPAGQGADLFAVGAPRALPASTNGKAGGKFLTDAAVTISNANQLQASAYKLQADPNGGAGKYLLTRLSDNLARSVAEGETVDGFEFKFNGAPLGASDTFVLEPVGQAALEMRRVLDQTSGIAAASPLSATTHIDNTGTITVNSLYAVNDQLKVVSDGSKVEVTGAPMTISFGAPSKVMQPDGTLKEDGSVPYALTLADGSVLNGTWSAGQRIGNQPNATPAIDLGFELTLNGVPRENDMVSIEVTKYTATNNGNAKAFLNIQTEKFIGQRLQPDGSLAVGSTVNEAYASSMSEIGSRVQGATYLSGVSVSVAADAEASRAGQAGVNIDEEASRLMQYQQGYQAAAKVLQAAQSIFDELMRIAAR